MPVPEFVLDLRRHVGHAPLWLIGVTAVVVRPSQGGAGGQEVLLVRRSDDGTWTPVTGIVDPGEEPHVAAVREVAEETRVQARVERLVQVSASPLVTHVNGDQARYLDHTVRCAFVSGEAGVGDDESSEVRWAPADDLPPMNDWALERVRLALHHDGPTVLGRTGAGR